MAVVKEAALQERLHRPYHSLLSFFITSQVLYTAAALQNQLPQLFLPEGSPSLHFACRERELVPAGSYLWRLPITG